MNQTYLKPMMRVVELRFDHSFLDSMGGSLDPVQDDPLDD